ncbi:endonuclease [Gordonia sp. 852002-50816_SCH5313054-c]|uniref:DUF692 domain-containing protein n=1 Tax=unclassified Gordonia (in: high G+C Gram-positive bacteria) TaxID=2657482 RepID=UPI0007EAADE3|nr:MULTISPECIES: DUF692 domain-containing protein [unclassified Gordonia (in: high G+C Gram-positive bacteria)]OBC12550.1 endonuclease [Gordonia sp. 852002-50816_SCH5313054-a]OBC19519.1 endonuclease [Gordonia sp. 852002-50816_SCH5313054-c]
MTLELPAGIGIGWRPEISGVIAQLSGLGFCEVIAESVPALDDPHSWLPDLMALNVPIIPHGVGLSLGGAEPVTAQRISVLTRCAETLNAPLVSEHIAFVRAGGVEAGHLLPVPRSREALDALTDNIRRTQDYLPVPLAVENIASLFEWPDDEYTDGEFLAELVERTGVYLLIDVANVYACAVNRGSDPASDLARLPLERVAYCHVAGGEPDGRLYHDTHTAPVPDDVLALVTQLAATGRTSAFLLERDGHYPPATELVDELNAIADAAGVDRPMWNHPWENAS